MQYEMNFGNLPSSAASAAAAGGKFRIAVLGDFSAAANAGRLETGDELAARKPHRVDVDNLDDVLGRFRPKLNLPIAPDGGSVEIEIDEMDDFHPDQLFDELDLFSEFAGLRSRLKNRGTFAAAAKEVQAWQGEVGEAEAYAAPRKDRSSAVPGGRLSDFARLVGRPTAEESDATAADELIRQIVGPHVVATKDPQQDKLIAAVDAALSDALRRVLHHPDFQTVESLWRSVELLVRNLETGAKLEIVLLDVTAEEFAADLSRADSLDQTGLYRLLVEQPALDAAQGPFAVIVGNYTFEQTPPHAELLGRMAKLAYAARAPFLAAVSNEYLKKPKPEDVHPLVTESWAKLRTLPEAAYLGLVVPRFLLRLPYGKKTEPIDPFDFEEFSKREGLRSMPWGNGAFVATLLLAQTFQKQGMKSMKLGSILSVGDMPYHYFTDDDGDQVALPCTDRLMTEALAAHAAGQGLMALVSLKGRPEVRLAGFQSPAGKQLLGPWSSETITPSAGSGRSAGSSSDAPSDEPSDDSATADEPTAAAEAASDGDESSSDAGGDDELAALLASLESPSTESSESGGEEVDPELAALLANL